MKCEQLRELLSADPRCQTPDALQHLDECSDCAEWAAELQSFEMQLSDAMQVEVPPGLEERILSKHQKPTTKVIPLHRKWHPALALAASLLLVVGLITSLNDQAPVDAFEQQMLAWLSDQQPAQYLDRQAPDAEVAQMFREVGAKLTGDIGTVHYCQVTRVDNHKVGYFVVSGEQGPVSVMLVANGAKNIFIQSPAGSDNSQAEQRIKQAIRWI